MGRSRGSPCLNLIKRYPRVGTTFYDLFAVRGADASEPR